MSVALASASPLKPEIRLAQAVSNFEADLSSGQKATFRTYRSQSCASPPSTSDVMRLTAEFDRRTPGQLAPRRCFGPRFTNVLQAIQQYAALGDIIVGSSQNLIACGVWSLVRMTLLVIVNFSSYLERLSILFMTVGRSAPRYQLMASLYPQSKNLQSNLSEYFLVVVQLCHQLLKFSQKSIFGQLASSLNDSDMKTYEVALELRANSIKEEMSLLTSQKIVEEARENSRFRALSSKFSETISHRKKLKTNTRVLNLCSSFDYETAWKQNRKAGNATLFNRGTEYQDWKTRSDSCTLLFIGKLGSGKSVLLANIVDDLNIYIQNKNITIAYFFCRHDVPESLKARTVIGSLAQQLLRPVSDLTVVADLLDETTSVLDFERIFILLQRALPPKCKAYFIIDGLDECDNAESQILIQQLRRLQAEFTLLLCVSFRQEADNALRLNSEQFTTPSIISVPDDNPDIEEFINAELENCIQSRRLTIGDPTLILEIQDALLKGAQGMFLWVALQIESLCIEKTDEALRQSLSDLPKDLSKTFDRVLQRSETLGKPYQRRILELVTVAHRPLTIEEIREALSVVPGDTVWNPARLLNDVYSTLACCGSLLTIDEEELTIRLVHHSVKQFLVGGFKDSTNVTFTIDNANRKMAEIIVTYLSYDIFHTQLSVVKVSQKKLEPAPSRIIRSTLDSSSNVQSLALKFLKSRKQSKFDIGNTLMAANKQFESRSVDDLYFYSYTKSYWWQHIWCISEQQSLMYSLLLKLFQRKALNTNTVDAGCRTPLSWAAAKGDEAMVRLLLDVSEVNAEAKDKEGRSALSWAARNGHESVVKLLLATDSVDPDSKDQDGRTPLSWAVGNGHEAVVKLLLATDGVDPDSKDQDGRTPLSWAVGNGHEAVVKLLLATDGVDPDSKDNWDDRTPLSWAARNGHEAVVKLLFATDGVDPDSKDNRLGRTPLSWAAENGHEAVVKLLLSTDGVDPDSKDNDRGRTPLSWAAENGHETVVKLLLVTDGVDPDSKGQDGRTPLSWAAENGHEAVVNPDSKDQGDRTPLSWAARNGHEAVVKLLLAIDGVDPDSKDNRLARTPLSWAAGNGHEAVVKLLLVTDGVDPDSKDNRLGQTPLSWAAGNGHEAVVKLLLATDGVDPDSKDNRLGQTPLSWAAENGHEAVVKLLLATDGVDPDSKDQGDRTPLSWAVGNGHEAVVKLLLATDGVNPDSKDNWDGRTPLSRAAGNGHEAVVKLLLVTDGVDPDSKDNTLGQTPLSRAAENGHEAVVKLLLATDGVDPDSRDNMFGRTPLSWAAENWHEAVVKLLQPNDGLTF